MARDGLRLAIRLSPRAKADRLTGVSVVGEGRRALAAGVTASPEHGRANKALLRLLAHTLRLPQRDLSIVAGASGRHKTVAIRGDPQRLGERLAARLAALPGR